MAASINEIDAALAARTIDIIIALFPHSWWFWLFVMATIAVKRKVIYPFLVKRYKVYYVRNLRKRRRQLRDHLNDPILYTFLERDVERALGRKPQEVQAEMERLRMESKQSVPDDCCKGVENEKAAILLLTISFGCTFLAPLSIRGIWPDFEGKVDDDDDFMFLFLSLDVFTLIHFVESYLLRQSFARARTRPGDSTFRLFWPLLAGLCYGQFLFIYSFIIGGFAIFHARNPMLAHLHVEPLMPRVTYGIPPVAQAPIGIASR